MSDSPQTSDTAQPYRVLARKYRPQTFDALIGQDAMVRTLRNAIESGRLAHAFVLTGVRGVGKTTTARLIARALNCVGPDGTGSETITPCGVCSACTQIAAGTHPDVIEMDAASNTGVDDVRVIIDNVPYAAASARYKIFIIDEVHMLSKNAFNALLKTLEEPPAHVKFIFATTEIRKVPVTVLSRCQRFDLRRIDEAMLRKHFQFVCDEEGVVAEEEALALIARAAEGSVRDGLSLLDQAMAHAGNKISADQVRAMIGLADPGQVLAIARHAFCGQPKQALEAFDAYYSDGGDPIMLVEEMLSLVHALTRTSVYGAPKPGHAGLDDADAQELSGKLSVPALNTAWQILAKGLVDVRSAARAAPAAEMLLVRLAYAATLPSPADLAKSVMDSAPSAPQERQAPAKSPAAPVSAAPACAQPGPAPTMQDAPVMQVGQAQAAKPLTLVPEPVKETPPAKPDLRLVTPTKDDEALLERYEALVEQVDNLKEGMLAFKMRDAVKLVSLDVASRHLALSPIGQPDVQFKTALGDVLARAAGEPWTIVFEAGSALPSLTERARAQQDAREARARAHPAVKKALAVFPGARIKDVRPAKTREAAPEEALPIAPDGYEVLPDSAYEDDMDLGGHPFDPDFDDSTDEDTPSL